MTATEDEDRQWVAELKSLGYHQEATCISEERGTFVLYDPVFDASFRVILGTRTGYVFLWRQCLRLVVEDGRDARSLHEALQERVCAQLLKMDEKALCFAIEL